METRSNLSGREPVGEAMTRNGLALEELENRVHERTAELLAINARLSAEIAEREQIEKELRKSDERYRVLVERVPDVIYGLKPKSGVITFLNLQFERVTGWPRAQWLGRPFAEIVHPEDLPLAKAVHQMVLDGKTPERYELRILCKDGHYGIGEFTSIPEMHEGRVVGQIGVVHDITHRKQIENELRESESRLRTILEGIPDPVWMKDRDGVFLKVNRAWCAFCGKEKEDVIGKSDFEVFDEAFASKVRREDLAVIQSEKRLRYEQCINMVRGMVWSDTVKTPLRDGQGRVIGTIGIARDITERKLMEEKLLRTQRMESLGALAGGIAHDLNNILGPIMMSASMLREKLPQATREELIASIQEATQRGAEIVNQILTYARGTKGERKVLDPHALISHVARILKETLPKSITLNSVLPEVLWNVTGDMTQLHQVFVNLCVNARDAMPDGGTLTLSAENRELSKAAAAKIPDAKPGRYVRIKVTDSGQGIAQEILEKIFDPFFTTKEPGKGTGLGLSTVIGIVKSHGGFMTVDSKPGKGTQFRVYFPATEETAALPPEPPPASRQPGGNGELVLVVDDEVSICKMVDTILKKKGYEVLTASGGKEALTLYQKHGATKIKAVLTDVAMPVMDGVTFAEALQKINPAVTLIASTGQSSEQRYQELRERGVHLFLSKPYSAQQLLAIVGEAISVASQKR